MPILSLRLRRVYKLEPRHRRFGTASIRKKLINMSVINKRDRESNQTIMKIF